MARYTVNAEAIAYYDRLRSKALATFVLPRREGPKAEDAFAKRLPAEQLRSMPFPCIEIVQDSFAWTDAKGDPTTDEALAVNKGTMRFSLVLGIDPGKEIWYFEKYVFCDGIVATSFDLREGMRRGLIDGKYKDTVPSALIELFERLADARHHRYVEVPTSRQVRRAEGLSPTYRSYVVVETPKRHNIPPGSLTLGELFRRHPKLHAVRGHMRTLQSGREVPVRPHVRGTGDVLQVKDYRVQSPPLTENTIRARL